MKHLVILSGICKLYNTTAIQLLALALDATVIPTPRALSMGMGPRTDGSSISYSTLCVSACLLPDAGVHRMFSALALTRASSDFKVTVTFSVNVST